ncbi:class I SAM-dependent methyltransferase [Mesorhizobium xinjiangense]|uniref:class I SAM-dependent methyltransferase n=1 Tax=Mesorhizobium xinjiangense TaxID=2678685 RepID=UPI0012EE741A|nr:class I SAM-dependent methyltransferase [Mesorhizobium xinjiangense]
MTALEKRIKALIAQTGPMSVADYMASCLFDPQDGYYTTREPFGTAGDFTTAPEINQMFGELVAVWIYSAWQAQDRPLPVSLVEIGPGRGTLMKDVTRTLRRLDAQLAAQAQFILIEASPRLRDVQARTLADGGIDFTWHDSLEALVEAPAFIIGNEIFDALPVRQFVKASGAWRERCVGPGDNDQLQFVLGPGTIDGTLLPADAALASDGAIFEHAPARNAMMTAISAHIRAHGGAGLFFDYGHLEPGLGDTLQAVRQHKPEGVFDHPGLADLTSHVDFRALAEAAKCQGLETAVMRQGDFLLAMGLLERAGRLGANAGDDARAAVTSAVERLAGPGAMGHLFKVLSVFPPHKVVHPFAGAH